ncbi:MAG: hypothetical protein SFV51_14720 [Bryobacteraceae bacterium]|nr:hypothetical protein [Bryobacteraceae bacterium]
MTASSRILAIAVAAWTIWPAATQQQPPADPLVGVWELNVAKSTAEGRRLPQKVRETITEHASGLLIRRERVYGDGKVTDQTFHYVFDGKNHPVELGGDAKHTHHTMRFERKGPGVIERKVDHDHGKVISTLRHTLSPDGKTITVLSFGSDDGTGKPYKATVVFEKR